MTSTISMKVGETRSVRIAISSSCCEPFTVDSATWELMCGEEIDESGDCDIEFNTECTRHVLTALICPQRKNAMYVLRFRYTIYPENFIYEVNVRVT